MTDARAELLRLIGGFQASQALHVAATLGLADRLTHGPASAEEIAGATGVHLDALARLMRALAAIGVIERIEGDRFLLTAMGEFLRRDIWGTCAPLAELIGRPNVWCAWGDLLHTVNTGATAFNHVQGCSIWDYRSRHPEEAGIFDRTMASDSEAFAQAVLNICDFGRFAHVVDVGGGDGTLLAKILDRYPSLHGTLFDQPHVVAALAASRRHADARWRAVGGDFFASVPESGDAYVLKWILHDWSDAAAVEILKSCRRAMRRSARLLVADYVLGADEWAAEGAMMDLMMMVMNGGRERTHAEFAQIFAAAGFRLVSITPTATPLCLIEGVPDGT